MIDSSPTFPLFCLVLIPTHLYDIAQFQYRLGFTLCSKADLECVAAHRVKSASAPLCADVCRRLPTLLRRLLRRFPPLCPALFDITFPSLPPNSLSLILCLDSFSFGTADLRFPAPHISALRFPAHSISAFPCVGPPLSPHFRHAVPSLTPWRSTYKLSVPAPL